MVHCTWLHKVLGPLEFQWNALLITNQIPAILVQKADWSKIEKKVFFLRTYMLLWKQAMAINLSTILSNTEYATWFQVLYLSVHLFKFCLLDIFLKDIIINVLTGIEEKNSFDYFVFVVGGGMEGLDINCLTSIIHKIQKLSLISMKVISLSRKSLSLNTSDINNRIFLAKIIEGYLQ